MTEILTIPKGTKVLVADVNYGLREHVLRHDYRYRWDCTVTNLPIRFQENDEEWMFVVPNAEVAERWGLQGFCRADYLNHAGFTVLATADPNWPYIVFGVISGEYDPTEHWGNCLSGILAATNRKESSSP